MTLPALPPPATLERPASAMSPVTAMTEPTDARPRPTHDLGGVGLVHRTDPADGRVATWRVVPLQDSSSGECWVERADGVITHPAVWMQAARTSRVVSAAEAAELLGEPSGD